MILNVGSNCLIKFLLIATCLEEFGHKLSSFDLLCHFDICVYIFFNMSVTHHGLLNCLLIHYCHFRGECVQVYFVLLFSLSNVNFTLNIII